MHEGRYLYCILEGNETHDLGNIGMDSSKVYTVGYNDLSAVVSHIHLKKIEPSVTDLIVHQKVIETARSKSTVLPVRFGTLLKNDQGIYELLSKSYKDFKTKIENFRDKDEYGIKVLLEKSAIKKIKTQIKEESNDARQMRKELATAKPGTSYLLKIKYDDLIKKETLKKIDSISYDIHQDLSKLSEASRVLETNFDQIILNVSYLVGQSSATKFKLMVDKLERKYKNDGLVFHAGGPWAPFSFC